MIRSREAIDRKFCNAWIREMQREATEKQRQGDKKAWREEEDKHWASLKALRIMVREYVDLIGCSINSEELTNAITEPDHNWYKQPISYIVRDSNNKLSVTRHVIGFEKDIEQCHLIT